MTEDERFAAISMIAADPQCGPRIEGGGGIRKVRFGIGGRGKRGGVRIVYYYHHAEVPVFLLTVFAKNEKSDLGRVELAALAKIATKLAENYGGAK